MTYMLSFIYKYGFLIALGLLLSGIIPIYYLFQLKIDNSIEVWLMPQSTAYREYQDFLNRFGSDEYIIVGMESDNPFSNESLDLQRSLAEKLRTLAGVQQTIDLPSFLARIDLADGFLLDSSDLFQVVHNFLIGKDRTSVGLFVVLDHTLQTAQRATTVERIERIVREFEDAGHPIHLAGAPYLNVMLDRYSVASARLFFPISILFSIIVLFYLFRHPAAVFAPLLAIGCTIAWTVGMMGMLGMTLNMVTIVLPTLLFVLTLSNGIHFVHRYLYDLSHTGSIEARNHTIASLIQPTFYAALTTAVGFASLMLSDMKPVADLGCFAAIGMGVSYVCNVFIVPFVLQRFLVRTRLAYAKRSRHIFSRIVLYASSHARSIVLASLSCLVLFLFVCRSLKPESNVLSFFPQHSKIVKDYRWIGEHLTGFYSVEMDIHKTGRPENEIASVFAALSEQFDRLPGVSRAVHRWTLATLADPIHSANVDDNGMTAFFRPYSFQSPQGDSHYRLSLLIHEISSDHYDNLIRSIQSITKSVVPSEWKWNITGIVPLLNRAQKSLVTTQSQSFGVAAIVVFAAIAILFRSGKVMLVSIIPNVLPVLLTLVCMVFTNVPIDSATVMIASVAIGIAVDDTIHLLFHFQTKKHEGIPFDQAMSITAKEVGIAMMGTTLVIAAGFSVLAFAQFRPIAYFGVLTGFTMLTAFFADIFILPACIKFTGLWSER